MRLMKLVAAIACIAMPAGANAAQAGPPAPAVQQTVAEDPGHASIPVVIWAPAAGSDLPLIVMSHGTGASPLAHIDTAQALAQAGFVVVAPMHPGDNFQDQSTVGRPEWLANRARHVGKVIDFMLTQWPGHDRLNARRVGIFGFSAGATTALIAVGGVPDLGRAVAQCSQAPEFVCQLLVPQPAGAPAPQWVHDPRIAAAVVAAPGLGFAFEPSGLAQVRVPVQLWVGAQDQTVPYATNGAVVRRLLPAPPEFHEVAEAVHLSFLTPCGPDTNAPPQLCADRPGFDRAAFHRDFNQAVVDFFRRQLGTE